jgi:SAM-dependent methyltransferase
MMSDALRWYDQNISDVSRRYESVAAETVHGWLVDLLPNAPALVLDVGAGTGRDAAWLASRGLEVVAVEPSGAMRTEAQRLHPSPSIRWVSDSLPSLDQVLRLGLSFDLILLSAVWMHVPLAHRTRAFRKLVTLLKPGGCMAITLRHGLAEPERGIHAVSQAEIERLARAHGAFVEKATDSKDELGRDAVSWTQVAVRLPDDGSGTLPLLRHLILNDDKSSTYKPALLRALCRIADGASGYARDTEDGHVAVPLGLVGLYWIRLFKPLLAAGLPQSPTNRGDEQLGFVKEGFRRLSSVSHLDLRIGMLFGGDRANALHDALRDACNTINRMPAHYMTYPGGGPVLPVNRVGRVLRPGQLHLDSAYLFSFGSSQGICGEHCNASTYGSSQRSLLNGRGS